MATKKNGIKLTGEHKREHMKKRFLKLYSNNLCNVKDTCKELNINRGTYYLWIKNDPLFKEQCDMIQEGLIDLAESQLMTNIKNGKEQSLLFFLRCKGRDRGYVEKKEVEHSGNVSVNIVDDIPQIIEAQNIMKAMAQDVDYDEDNDD